MVNQFFIEYLNIISYKLKNDLFYVSFQGKVFKHSIPWSKEGNFEIISYDIDVLSRTIFLTTNRGFFKFTWGKDLIYTSEFTKINDRFKKNTKIRYDNVGRNLYISDNSGIHLAAFPYMDFTTIIENEKILNFEIIPDIGFIIFIIEY